VSNRQYSAAEDRWYAEVSERVRMAREMLFTQEDLGKWIGVPKDQITAYENFGTTAKKQRRFPAHLIRKLALVLHTGTEFLMEGNLAAVDEALRPALLLRYRSLLDLQPEKYRPFAKRDLDQALSSRSPLAALILAPRSQENDRKVHAYFDFLRQRISSSDTAGNA